MRNPFRSHCHRRCVRRELLRTSRAFRLLWFAQIASLFGDWFNVIASSTLLAQLTGAGAALGALFAVRMLGSFFASPLAGVLADRYNRKRILIVTDLLRAVVVLGLLLVREPHHVWLLFLLTGVQVGISGVFFPVRVAILPEVASRRLLGPANALSSATWSTMLAVGAAAGGVFAGVFGIAAAFILDAATYVVSALLLIRMPYTANQKRSTADAPVRLGATVRAGIAEYTESLGYLWRHRRVLVVTLQKSFLSFFFSGFQVASVAIAGTVFPLGHAGGTTVGLLFAAGGVGSGLGPLVVQPFLRGRHRSLRVAMLAGYLLMSAALALAAPLASLTLVLIGIRGAQYRRRHGVGVQHPAPPGDGARRAAGTGHRHRARRHDPARRRRVRVRRSGPGTGLALGGGMDACRADPGARPALGRLRRARRPRAALNRLPGGATRPGRRHPHPRLDRRGMCGPARRQSRQRPGGIGPPLLEPGVERRLPGFDQRNRLLGVAPHPVGQRTAHQAHLHAHVQLVEVLVSTTSDQGRTQTSRTWSQESNPTAERANGASRLT